MAGLQCLHAAACCCRHASRCMFGRPAASLPPAPCSLADDEAAEPPRLPIVVVMPDGQSLCTAREDAAWAAAVAAADGGDPAQKQGGLAAAAAAASAPSRRWWERLPVGLVSPGRRQAQQRQEGQPQAAGAAAGAASSVELASAVPEPASQQLPSGPSHATSATGEQGTGEGSSREGSRHGPSSRASSQTQQQQQGAVQLRPQPESRRRSRSATRDAAAAGAALQRMVRASTGQQLAMQQAGVAPLSPRPSLSPRRRRPVPIFDVEVGPEVAFGVHSGGSSGADGVAVRPGSAASSSGEPGLGGSGAAGVRPHSSMG